MNGRTPSWKAAYARWANHADMAVIVPNSSAWSSVVTPGSTPSPGLALICFVGFTGRCGRFGLPTRRPAVQSANKLRYRRVDVSKGKTEHLLVLQHGAANVFAGRAAAGSRKRGAGVGAQEGAGYCQGASGAALADTDGDVGLAALDVGRGLIVGQGS